MTIVNTDLTLQSETPFRHFRVDGLLTEDRAGCVLEWFKTDAPWRLVVEDFYEQYEFSLLTVSLGAELRFLTSSEFVADLRKLLLRGLTDPSSLSLTEITAHKLVPGQTIRVHNDFIGDEETHRMLIQINDGWRTNMGGLLILFSSPRPEDISSIIVPDHNSGFGFEISSKSFHAVSTIHAGERYTLVYTFKRIE